MKATSWLRVSYWTGAIVDALAAIQILVPSIFAATNKLSDFNPGGDFGFAAGMAASLMLGWTCLLLWADRKPVERKGVLPITVFPVILGLVANELRAVGSQFLSFEMVTPIWVLQAGLVILFMFSYLNARKTESQRRAG